MVVLVGIYFLCIFIIIDRLLRQLLTQLYFLEEFGLYLFLRCLMILEMENMEWIKNGKWANTRVEVQISSQIPTENSIRRNKSRR